MLLQDVRICIRIIIIGILGKVPTIICFTLTLCLSKMNLTSVLNYVKICLKINNFVTLNNVFMFFLVSQTEQ